MKYIFDLDGTLCTKEKDHKKSKPFEERINYVNQLYAEGNDIMIDTARGSETGINWKELTKKQLKEWGVKYHRLRVGEKLHADCYVDDKAQNSNQFFK